VRTAALVLCACGSVVAPSPASPTGPASPAPTPVLLAAPALALDQTFGTGGRLTIDKSVLGAVVLDDDSLVAIATLNDPDNPSGTTALVTTGLVAIDASGTMRTMFGDGGFASLSGVAADAIVRDRRGRFVLTGTHGDWPDARVAITRVLPDGKLDASFGTAGTSVFGLGQDTRALSTTVLANGELLVVGQLRLREAFLVRLDERGAVIPGSRRAIATIPEDHRFGAAVISGDGAIIVSGYTLERTHPEAFVVRADQSGTVQHVERIHEPQIYTTSSLLVDARQRIIVGAMALGPVLRGPMVLVRLTPDGDVDPTFANHGSWVGKDDAQVMAMVPGRDGEVIVLGTIRIWVGSDPTFIQVSQFDDRGIALPALHGPLEGEGVTAAVVDHHGRVVIFGASLVYAGDVQVPRELGVVERYASP
jgi:hypothetical protein